MFGRNFTIPLTNIFNESFRSRIFPKIWKRYNVCAIQKVTPCSAVEDLGPISLTSVLSKIQESYAIEWINQDVGANVNESYNMAGYRDHLLCWLLLTVYINDIWPWRRLAG